MAEKKPAPVSYAPPPGVRSFQQVFNPDFDDGDDGLDEEGVLGFSDRPPLDFKGDFRLVPAS